MDKKVIVLMSTYNGEKYIKQQIDSILNQTYKNIELYIKDDCSSDNTYKILQEYNNKYKNIHISKSKNNLGYPKCFYALTDSAVAADYYFFADQDDIWLEDKIERAVNIINEKSNNNKPFAYYSGYYVCDGEMNRIGISNKRKEKISFRETLFEVCGLEFTMAINKKALDLLNSHKPAKAKARGTWMSMLFSSFGEVYYDNYQTALYRRHNKSVTSSKMKGIGLWLWRINKFLKNDEFDNYKIILNDFYDVCNNDLNEKDSKIIKIFINYSFINRFRKAFYPKRLRSKITEEFALRFVFLIGKL